jgi:hypothetical protein
MARKVFYSFHYLPDGWRVAQIRNAGVLEGNQPVSDNRWESITKGGDAAIKKWIQDEMSGKSCAVVLIGANTAGRKWINYELEYAWAAKKGVVGIFIHQLKDRDGNQATKGANPLRSVYVTQTSPLGVVTRPALSQLANAYEVKSTDSQAVYKAITSNLGSWVDEAIAIRKRHP